MNEPPRRNQPEHSETKPESEPEEKTTPFLKLLTYFWGPIPWMIEAAVILSAIAQHWPDFGIIILLLLVANGVIGFWGEREAGNTIEALKAKLAITARARAPTSARRYRSCGRLTPSATFNARC